jgi:hypothetical protein
MYVPGANSSKSGLEGAPCTTSLSLDVALVQQGVGELNLGNSGLGKKVRNWYFYSKISYVNLNPQGDRRHYRMACKQHTHQSIRAPLLVHDH